MTIEEMKEARRQAEQAIFDAVQKFMTDTGLRVNDLDVRIGFIDYSTFSAEPVRRVTSVELDVRL